MEDVAKEKTTIPWSQLLKEFEGYQLDATMEIFDGADFVASLVNPPPAFVEVFLKRKGKEGLSYAEKIRLMYAFLLRKRYEEKLNLLHFAFHIFDERTHLPEGIIDQTPFPHEDGIPSFKHFQNPDFVLDPTEC